MLAKRRLLHHNTTIEEIIDQVTEISRQHNILHLSLFGSYATGEATESSDIDFVAYGIGNKDSYLEQIDQIRTLKTIDIFDYDSIRNPRLKEDIEKYGRKIY